MVQSSLVERARNGNPQAIASLMNLVLEPKGVVAKTQLEGQCLHIVFTSEHLLSQSAIATFVKNGLTSLGTHSVHTVKLYAQKIGQEQPQWIDSFALGSAAISPPQAKPRPAAPRPVPPQPVSRMAMATDGTAPLPRMKPTHTGKSPLPPRSPASVPGKRRKPVTQQRKVKPGSPTWQRFERSLHAAVWQNPYLNSPFKIAIAVSLSAFAVGGIAALMSHSSSQSSTDPTAPSTNTDPSSVPLALNATSLNPPRISGHAPGERPPALTPGTSSEAFVRSPEAARAEPDAIAYLTQMTQAQQAFYQANGRLADNLEELARSANATAWSDAYTFRLTVREQTQALLTAVPKQPGLKSYASLVLAGNATAAIVCQTKQPSPYPPILAQTSPDQPPQCPADASPVLNSGS